MTAITRAAITSSSIKTPAVTSILTACLEHMELLGCPTATGGVGEGGGTFLILGKDDVGNGGGTGIFSGILHTSLSLQFICCVRQSCITEKMQ